MKLDTLHDPTATFDRPFSLLRGCHARIERQLLTLERLVRHLPGSGADGSAREAAAAVLRYFDTAAPDHHADEEESLFPRLRASDSPAIADAIDRLVHDHVRLGAAWRRLRRDLAPISAGRRSHLNPADVQAMALAYRGHIALEEVEVFTPGEALLDAHALAAIGAEMAARRGLSADGSRRSGAEPARRPNG